MKLPRLKFYVSSKLWNKDNNSSKIMKQVWNFVYRHFNCHCWFNRHLQVVKRD